MFSAFRVYYKFLTSFCSIGLQNNGIYMVGMLIFPQKGSTKAEVEAVQTLQVSFHKGGCSCVCFFCWGGGGGGGTIILTWQAKTSSFKKGHMEKKKKKKKKNWRYFMEQMCQLICSHGSMEKTLDYQPGPSFKSACHVNLPLGKVL